jgi:hypothetical protein
MEGSTVAPEASMQYRLCGGRGEGMVEEGRGMDFGWVEGGGGC